MNRIVPPKIVNIELTTFCALRCPQCYKLFQNTKDVELELENVKQYIEELKAIGTKKILLSGGEPLSYEGLVELVRYIRKNGMEVYLSTGGIGMDEKYAEKLKEADISAVYISLNGSTEEINSLSRDGYSFAIDTGNICKKTNIPLRINWVARGDNCEDFKNIINLAESLCVEQIDILMNKHDASNDLHSAITKTQLYSLAEFIKNYKGNVNIGIESCYFELKNAVGIKQASRLLRGCSAGKYSMTINAYGRVSPCTHADYSIFEDLSKYDSLKDYWENSPIVNEFRSINKPWEVCVDCERRMYCEPCKIRKEMYCNTYILEEGAGE